jgi:cbb3-type cytochrome oxidase subunit 3
MTVSFLTKDSPEQTNQRIIYVIVFCAVLLLSIILTLVIYYFVRYKKKYFFDAAGRKFIESTGELSNLENKLMEIIQFDNHEQLEDEVISKF